ncbi:protein abrupt-like isoform X2 [Diachasmimorpha longicaudata]|uniref:protein abrupt-like isoform X2 n=1 Tax=Diachasmimorpha longicaudata TaxID=58733 RepID=UPI0030B8EE77
MTDSQQQFCLRWNNFQANITSQFEALRDDEDFVDVTFACDGRRLQAHKVVLSACSPYFKELFKTNPCKHPIIFMRDVEFEHLQSLLEFMYAGEVNISQAELPTFLRTAESLQIRGLTDSQNNQHSNEKHSKSNNIHALNKHGLISPTFDDERSKSPPASSPPPLKRLCKKSDSPKNSSPVPAVTPCATNTPRTRPLIEPQVQLDCFKDLDIVEPKVELPEYGSDEDFSPKQEVNAIPGGFLSLDGGMEVLPSYPSSYQSSGIEGALPGPSHSTGESNQEQADLRKLHSLDPRPCLVCNRMYSNLSNLRQHMRLIHNPQSVTCPICSKSFKTKLYLKRHLVSFHDVNPSDRQLQEEIYQHQLKVQVQGQSTAQHHQQVQNGVDTQQSNDSMQNAASPGSQQQNCNDDSNGGGEGKLRAYHAQIGDSAYPVEVIQINESKNFGNIVQFNASF